MSSLRLKNYRSYSDTGPLELRKLNVFIGPNNAGKSSLMSAVELLFRSFHGFRIDGPLAFDELPSFASFDSLLRRHWSNKEPRAHEFNLAYTWTRKRVDPFDLDFVCRGREKDNTSYVHQATYKIGDRLIVAVAKRPAPGRITYDISMDGTNIKDEHTHFVGILPNLDPDSPKMRSGLYYHTEVVRPYRPVPRSFYVLDDPGLSKEDRALISFLIEIWDSQEPSASSIQKQILKSLTTLGLVHHLEVKKVGGRVGPKIVEIRVAPSAKRQAVTIADVGFGLSQALPLVAYDARLTKGALIAYQPEMHLHPFAQSRLADIFVDSVERGNQIFVETHSAEMILRLQLQVVSGRIRPDDVRVFCIENTQGTSTIQTVKFDKKGSPTIPWPAGFLDTSLTIARELATKRIGNR